tara:strand:+ start:830 stop:4048 length:3219 start_codon:yes stop_codon:yes gene_type:complete
MQSPSINIGICSNGKSLIRSIDEHFKHQEPRFHENYILSASINNNKEIEGGFILETIKEGQFTTSSKENISTWFEYDLHGEINNLVNLTSVNFNGSINVNLVLPLAEKNSIYILDKLLHSISKLKKGELIGNISIKIFSIIYPIDNKYSKEVKINEEIDKLQSVSKNYETIVDDIFYFDDKNTDKVHLKLNDKWLGFALGEYFMFQMIQPGSLALTGRNKVFGMSIVHFNEVLFREVIANKILDYKFDQEGINNNDDIQLQDIVGICNPFIKKHQNFFKNFTERHPYTTQNETDLTKNAKDYILDFKRELSIFIEKKENKIGESKVIIANLIGENDDLLGGIDWKGERLILKDLENDIIEYFNDFLEENDRVEINKEKTLKSDITHTEHGIKSDKKNIEKINDQSQEIHSDIEISFDKGIFSVDGKRINASGYIPSPLNPDDEVYLFNEKTIPERIDLSSYFGEVKNQGELGSCTAFPVAAIYEFFASQNNQSVDISELFIYFNSRDKKGNSSKDIGATLFDTISSVKEKGACYSKTYPYNIDNFSFLPEDSAYKEAKHNIVEKSFRVEINEKHFKNALANGHPVVFGLKLFKSFYPKNDEGLITYPKVNEISLQDHGNHAMLLVGYNDQEKLFKVRNSWGSKFGDNGYCYIPYDYLANPEYCTEAFVITKIVDLSFNEFNYETSTSFSFLKDSLKRKKTILEYNLRKKSKDLNKLKSDYEIIAGKNEENTIQIKDPLFRLNIFNNITRANQTTPIIPPAQPDSNSPKIIMIIGVVLLIMSFFIYSTSLIGALICGLFSIGVFILGWKMLKNQTSQKNENPPVFDNNQINKKEQLYNFMTADILFTEFDKLDDDLIKSYRAISTFFTKIKNWKDENLNNLKSVDYSSPTFVINVVKEKPLLTYIENKKETFLNNLPNLSALFYESFIPKKNNVDEVFENLKSFYFDDIKNNIDSILDVSVIDYLLKYKTYPFFNSPPELSENISLLEKISNPFCNIKSTENIKSQHFAVYETIKSDKDSKENEIAKHYNPSIKPIPVNRENNRKKYVLIQVAALDDTTDIVRYQNLKRSNKL